MRMDQAYRADRVPGTGSDNRTVITVVVLAVLSQLQSLRYGYELRQSLVDKGMPIEEGTLYPLLRRLESQGLLISEWREQDKRNKRFYRVAESRGYVVAFEARADVYPRVIKWCDMIASTLKVGSEVGPR